LPASLLRIQWTPARFERLFVLCGATLDPLSVMCDGNFLRAHRARIGFVDIAADALDVAALRGPGAIALGGCLDGWASGPLLS
jgi:hypothetical protein